jgi:hypothetical protein
VRKLQGAEAKVSGPDVQKNNSAQGSPDGFVGHGTKRERERVLIFLSWAYL